MSDKKKTENKSDEEILEELRQFSKKALGGLFDDKKMPDFDETGVLVGNEDLLKKTDAELFPDELSEYTAEEKKPRVVIDNKPKK